MVMSGAGACIGVLFLQFKIVDFFAKHNTCFFNKLLMNNDFCSAYTLAGSFERSVAKSWSTSCWKSAKISRLGGIIRVLKTGPRVGLRSTSCRHSVKICLNRVICVLKNKDHAAGSFFRGYIFHTKKRISAHVEACKRQGGSLRFFPAKNKIS
jgi:hypothetical protein